MWRSVLDVGSAKLKLTVGKKNSVSEDQIFTINDIVPKLDLGDEKSALHGRFGQAQQNICLKYKVYY